MIFVAISLAFFLIAGCNDAPVEEIPDEEKAPDAGEVSSLGLGVVTSIGRSVVYDEESEMMAMAQVDSIIAGATFDQDGRVVDIMIDTAQVRVEFDEELQIGTDPTGEFRSKKELGDDYGMRNASEIEREWDEQIADLEQWMSGKRIDESK